MLHEFWTWVKVRDCCVFVILFPFAEGPNSIPGDCNACCTSCLPVSLQANGATVMENKPSLSSHGSHTRMHTYN